MFLLNWLGRLLYGSDFDEFLPQGRQGSGDIDG